MQNITYSREIPVRYHCDVMVVGGGPSGVAAAVTAARQGATVILVEAGTCLGGLGTAGLVPAFMSFTDGINFLAGGFGRDLLDRLAEENSGNWDQWKCSSIKVEQLKRVYESMMAKAGAKFIYQTKLIDVVRKGSIVESAICAGKSGLFAISAKTFIDGTGDGDLCVLAGADYKQGDADGNTMPGTLCSLWADIEWDRVYAKAGGLGAGNAKIEEAIQDGVFTHEDRHLPGMWRVSERIGGGNIGHTFGVDGTQEESLTAAFVWGRQSLLEYERYYKAYLKGFEKMDLVVTASLMGIRETRRITCDYELSVDDFARRAVFEDEIGRYSYPIDIHIAKPDMASYQQYKKDFSTRLGPGESYGIPYRSLTPLKLDNVWVAGRCVGTDRGMQASLRVMPGCFITGQAVGLAATLAVKASSTSRQIDVTDLQRGLRARGAFLPNFSE